MDLRPYVFQRLGGVFGSGTEVIAEAAEKWLIDRWGRSDDWHPAREDRRLRDVPYSERDTHHGTSPRTEDPRTAFEEAATLQVAGEMIDRRCSILVEEYEPVADPWQDWLGQYLDARPRCWAVDRREPVPTALTMPDVGFGDLKWPAITKSHALAVLGNPDSQDLVVSGFVHYAAGQAYGTDRVESALVAPTLAMSLKAAVEAGFQGEGFFYFNVPKDGDTWRDGEIDFGPFRLIGWLEDVAERETHLEQHDPLARLASGAEIPGRMFRECHSASQTEMDGIISGGRTLAWVQRFSDESLGVRESEQEPVVAGHRTFVATSALLGFLEEAEMSLIMHLQSTRRDGDQRDYEEADRQEEHHIILIDGKGRVNGLDECKDLGPGNYPGAGAE